MMMRPRLVASDLDGTLLTSDGSVDERSRRAIAAAESAGAVVVFCTARPPLRLKALAEATDHRGVAVCANGAVVYDLHTESVLEATTLEPATALELVDLLRAEMPGGAWAVERAAASGTSPPMSRAGPCPTTPRSPPSRRSSSSRRSS